MRKRIFLLYIVLFLFIIVSSMTAQAQPEPLVYQFFVRDQEGDLVGGKEVEVEMILMEGSLREGEIVYRERQTVTTSAEGLVEVKIGDGASEQNFSDITWDISKSYFVRARINNLLNTRYTFQHTSELVLVTPRVFTGTLADLSDRQIDTSDMGIEVLSIRDNKIYLTNGGVIELPRFMENVNSLRVKADKKDVSCHGEQDGAIGLSVAGGYPPYSYQWSNGETTKNLTELKAGDYQVYVTDSKGFTAVRHISINQPEPLKINPDIRHVQEVGGQNGRIELSPSGGRPPYDYQWSTGETTGTISGLSAGIYRVEVSSGYQCSVEKEFVVKEPVQLSFDKENLRCYGEQNGSARLKIHGGKAPYTIQWSNGETDRKLEQLGAGKYYVSVEDSWGYRTVDSVSILQPYPLQIEDSVENIGSDEERGRISLKVDGGFPPYTYSWSNGDTTRELTDVRSGVYPVTVEDNNGCLKRKNNIFVYRIMEDPRNSREYKVITIGGQNWMAENLNIGRKIPADEMPDNNGRIEKYCYDDSEDNCQVLGGLYTWNEAVQYSRPANKRNSHVQGVCPDGWHIPSEKEWQELSEYLRGEMVAGDKLKNRQYWERPGGGNMNQRVIDGMGFSALPAGRIDLTGQSYYKGVSTSFWSASQPSSDKAWHRTITTGGSGLYRDASYTGQKYSVRCIKDKK